MVRKATDIVSLSLRIREGLRRRLEREAKKDNQSLNAEIVDRLDQSFDLAKRQSEYDAMLSFAAAGNKYDAMLLKLIASAMWKLRSGPRPLSDEEYAERLLIAIVLIIADVARLPSYSLPFGRSRILEIASKTMERRVPGQESVMPADAEALLVAEAVLRLDRLSVLDQLKQARQEKK
jgi:hypothetical protein